MSAVQRLIEVNSLIVEIEKQLDSLYNERDRLTWELDSGDHTD